MSEALNLAYQGVDREWEGESASTRRRFVQGAAATLGGLGVFGLLSDREAIAQMGQNDPQTILNVAATAEVLATIVNTVGPEKLGRGRRGLDRVTRRNIRAAARQELIHYEVLTSIGAKELTKRIWVPDAAFASRKGLLTTLEAGDQIFVNAYLIGTTVFANAGKGTEARYTGEFMGVEAVHRALARQSLGKLGQRPRVHALRVHRHHGRRQSPPGRRLRIRPEGHGQGPLLRLRPSPTAHPEPRRRKHPQAKLALTQSVAASRT